MWFQLLSESDRSTLDVKRVPFHFFCGQVDQDGDGEISFSEFFQMMKKKERDEDSKKKEKKANGGENVAAKENGAGE